MRKNGSGDESKKNRILKIWLLLSGLFFGTLVLFAIYLGMRFLPERAVTYDSMEDHFKYGSTRGDLVTGIPFWIWQAMPLVCADTLEHITAERLAPDYRARVAMYQSGDDAAAQRLALSREGYKAMGFIYEQDANGQERDMPIGTSQRRSLGLDRSYINCSVCHMSTVRKDEADPGTLILGMPANREPCHWYAPIRWSILPLSAWPLITAHVSLCIRAVTTLQRNALRFRAKATKPWALSMSRTRTGRNAICQSVLLNAAA